MARRSRAASGAQNRLRTFGVVDVVPFEEEGDSEFTVVLRVEA
jgi:hypothetical protein